MALQRAHCRARQTGDREKFLQLLCCNSAIQPVAGTLAVRIAVKRNPRTLLVLLFDRVPATDFSCFQFKNCCSFKSFTIRSFEKKDFCSATNCAGCKRSWTVLSDEMKMEKMGRITVVVEQKEYKSFRGWFDEISWLRCKQEKKLWTSKLFADSIFFIRHRSLRQKRRLMNYFSRQWLDWKMRDAFNLFTIIHSLVILNIQILWKIHI